MREIKFRAWDSKWEKMYYSHGDNCRVQLFHGDWEVDTEFENGDTAETIDCDNKRCFLMQFTGLKDKNGKEIYEGDIVYQYNDESNKVFELRKNINPEQLREFEKEEEKLDCIDWDKKFDKFYKMVPLKVSVYVKWNEEKLGWDLFERFDNDSDGEYEEDWHEEVDIHDTTYLKVSGNIYENKIK